MSPIQTQAVSGNPPGVDSSALQRLETILGETIGPSVVQARAAFRRSLPQLLQDHAGRWVAYHGERRVAVGDSKTGLYQQCLNQGLRRGDFLVLRVEPETKQDIEVPIDV